MRTIRNLTALLVGMALIFGTVLWVYADDAHESCTALTNLAAAAMDQRLDGMPAHETAQLAADEISESEQKLWVQITGKVYQLPANYLSGTNRADFLTQVYIACSAEISKASSVEW